jgi:hypothetical protein
MRRSPAAVLLMVTAVIVACPIAACSIVPPPTVAEYAVSTGPAAGEQARLQALVRAYPDALAGIEGPDLVWRDGTRMAITDEPPGKSLQEMLRSGSILDQINRAYPAGAAVTVPAPDDDPGRVRNRAFFDKMYGDCHRGEVAPHLVPVVWLPSTWCWWLRESAHKWRRWGSACQGPPDGRGASPDQRAAPGRQSVTPR